MTQSTGPRNKPLTVQQSYDRWFAEHGYRLRDALRSSQDFRESFRCVWEAGHRAGVRRARYHGDVRGKVDRAR